MKYVFMEKHLTCLKLCSRAEIGMGRSRWVSSAAETAVGHRTRVCRRSLQTGGDRKTREQLSGRAFGTRRRSVGLSDSEGIWR